MCHISAVFFTHFGRRWRAVAHAQRLSQIDANCKGKASLFDICKMAMRGSGCACRRLLCLRSEKFSRSLSNKKMCCDCRRRWTHTQASQAGAKFGILFDIDGVIVRGRTLLPTALDAFNKLTDGKGNFRVPTVFVTNAGNTLRQQKAEQLSNWLGTEIVPEQVIMSHSPLRMFKQFHDKHCLISGQGPILDIARGLGFTKVTTVETMRSMFPMLDMVDHKRRVKVPCAFAQYFPKIDAVILFGEPVRWETNLQLIIDVLMTAGQPSLVPDRLPYPHIPVLACNMDLLWMAEASMPRFGHGCFLVCLEHLYKKITGKELKYTALIGKPSEVTYHHAEHTVAKHARSIGLKENQIRRLYAIGHEMSNEISDLRLDAEVFAHLLQSSGIPDFDLACPEYRDNPETDIYGANLYNRYLESKLARQKQKKTVKKAAQQVLAGSSVTDQYNIYDDPDDEGEVCEPLGAESCDSILVQTGVFSDDSWDDNPQDLHHHGHRDFGLDPLLKKPNYIVKNVLAAIDHIFSLENFS